MRNLCKLKKRNKHQEVSELLDFKNYERREENGNRIQTYSV